MPDPGKSLLVIPESARTQSDEANPHSGIIAGYLRKRILSTSSGIEIATTAFRLGGDLRWPRKVHARNCEASGTIPLMKVDARRGLRQCDVATSRPGLLGGS